jgi:putative DNA primase/helicase
VVEMPRIRRRENEIALRRPVEVVVAKPRAPEPAPVAARIVKSLKPKEPAPHFGEGPALPVAAVVLSAQAPYDTAKEFTRRHCAKDGKLVVYFWQGQFWRWNGRHYEGDDKEHTVLRGKVYEFLDKAHRWAGHGQTVPFQPKPEHVNAVLDGLRAGLALGVECQPPMWLDTRQPATEWIVFQNRIVNVLTGEVRELTPNLWVHSALGFDWEPEAQCPRWQRFLEELFPGDEESKQCLEEWTGYCMTEETKFQKGAMLLGPKRSGRGTWTHVMRKLVGDESYVGLSFNTWTSGDNSREVLIGKRVGVFSDVRFKPGKMYGQNWDAGGITHKDAELALNITGEDTITIPRKYIGAWRGQLRLKLTVISNEVPNLNDSSGVLPSRFVKVRFSVSFFGREDVNLRAKLEAELPGIAVRCLKAHRRLCERGRFVQPKSAEVLELELAEASGDPFAAMALETFAPDAEGTVTKTVAYMKFELWCRNNGRMDLFMKTRNNKFGERLREVAGFERVTDMRPHGQPRQWLGMRLRPEMG